MLLPDEERLPRDPERLIREVDAAIKIKDIERVHRYREQLSVKWWESGIIVLLFISGLGFIVTVYKLVPTQNTMLFWFVFFWFAMFTFTLLITLEFIYLKLCALRKLYELNSKALETLQKQMHEHSGDHQA